MGFYDRKKVFIIGGSAGIGRETALLAAREGADVYVAARGQQRLDETVALLEAAAVRDDQAFGSVSVDVTDAEAVRAASGQVLEGLGGLDVLICNTGYAETGTIATIDDDAFRRLIDVNYFGHVHAVRAFSDHFIEQKSGHIALVSSLLAVFSTWGYGAYSASKYAITGLAEALRQEMKRHGVGVTLFYPPTTDTPGFETENEDKHPVLFQLEHDNNFTWVHEPDEVAVGLLAAIRKNRFESYVGWDSWLVYTTCRYLPGLARWLNDRELEAAFRKVEAREPGAIEGA